VNDWGPHAGEIQLEVEPQQDTVILTVTDLIHMLQALGHTYRPPVRPCDVEETMSRVWRDRT
jgi:hypothetical protein